MGVGPVELSLRDVESVPVTLGLFLRPGSPGTESFLLSTASECLLFFNLSECSEDADNLPWVRLTLGFFEAAEVGEGLADRVSRLLCGAKFVSFSGDVSMGSSEVEDFGLEVPFFTLSFETPLLILL